MTYKAILVPFSGEPHSLAALGTALDLPPLGGDSNRAGPVLTKTLLIYALTAGGTDDGPRLVAVDKATGGEIASVDLPGGAIGSPSIPQLISVGFGSDGNRLNCEVK